MRSLKCATVVAAAPFVLSGVDARAASINYSFGATLGAGETAGAPGVNSGNFNPITNASQAITNPLDSTGASTSANTVFAGQGFGFNGGGGTNDAHLFSGFFDQSDTATSTLTVSNVPYDAYDVYIYMRNDRDGNPNDRSGKFTINGADRFARGPSADANFDPSGGGLYVLSEDATQTTIGGTTAGNYVRFNGLTDDTLTVSFGVGLAPGTAQRNKFVGLQIVEVPEPASLGLAALGGLGLLARRRAR